MTHSEQILLSASGVCVARGGEKILDQIDLTVSVGDFITVVGPNGAGKSTMLKCLLGFMTPDSGTLFRKPGLRVGYVPQRLMPDHSLPMTVRRFLTLRNRADGEKALAAAAETGAERLLDAQLSSLSGGELQRALLARALTSDPEILALDEPAQNMDLSGQIAFYKLLDRLYAARRMAVLMISHDLHLVMSSTKHVVCLFKHICCSGEPEAVTRAPAFRSLFGDDMARLTSFYQHGGGGAHRDHTHDGPCRPQGTVP